MQVNFTVDGKAAKGTEGELLVVAMMNNQCSWFKRNPVDQTRRAPFCMMGLCHECVVKINGQSSMQACLTPLSEGMKVERSE